MGSFMDAQGIRSVHLLGKNDFNREKCNMNPVNFPTWANEIEKAVTEINRVTSQIPSVMKKLRTNDILIGDSEYTVFDKNISETLKYWTGQTYIGQRKDKRIENAFQRFFETLYNYLIFCRDEDHSFCQLLKNLSDRALYQGVLYRYLGHGLSNIDRDKRVEPVYNKIFVSWSKNSTYDYLENKLYGVMTVLTCEVSDPYYGIDLSAFGASKMGEDEVVFPTIRETIIRIDYKNEDRV